MLEISVIIPYYNELEQLENCLRSIRSNTHYPLHEVIVVADGSPQMREAAALVDQIRPGFPCRLFFHKREQNRGFVYTCNEGAELAGGDYLFFLNEDTIVQRGSIANLALYAEQHREAGILGSKLIYPDNQLLQHIGGAFRGQNEFIHIYQSEFPFQPFLQKNRSLQWLTGAALFISASDFRELEKFEQDYISSSEDTDLCFKMRFRMGKQVVVVASSVIWHVSNLTGVTKNNMVRTKKLFLERWQEKLKIDEFQIYEADGFHPEIIQIFRKIGFPKKFSLYSFILNEIGIGDLKEQSVYLKKFGESGLKQELRKIWNNNAAALLSQAPDAFLTINPGGELPELFRLSENQLWKLLADNDHSPVNQRKILNNIFEKFDDKGVFLSIYNLASYLERNGQSEEASSFFRILLDFPESNRELSGKAAFKLAGVCQDLGEKKSLLLRCLDLYPAHSAARKMLDNICPGNK